MKNVRRIVAIVLVLSLLFVLTACSKKDKLIGAWKFTETGEKITFQSDGTFLWEESGDTAPGKYVLDGDSLTLDFGGGDVGKYHIDTLNDSTLVLSSDGETMTFVKQ